MDSEAFSESSSNYSKTGVCRGIPIFLIFVYQQSKKEKGEKKFTQNFLILQLKNLCILNGKVFIMFL